MHGSDNGNGAGGRHRRVDPYRGRHRGDQVREAGRRALRRPAAVALLVLFGGASIPLNTGSEAGSSRSTSAVELLAERELAERAARADTRTATSVPAIPPQPTASVPPTATAPSANPRARATVSRAPAQATTATQPVPVGGLNQKQMNHAATIVRVGQQLGLPQRAYVIAIATALQESYLRNLANYALPESLRYTNEGVGADHDSVGLFQQRTTAGWGTVAELMNPATSARKFYDALQRVSGWQGMSLARAAQAVQVSAFPDAYAKHEPLATRITNALV